MSRSWIYVVLAAIAATALVATALRVQSPPALNASAPGGASSSLGLASGLTLANLSYVASIFGAQAYSVPYTAILGPPFSIVAGTYPIEFNLATTSSEAYSTTNVQVQGIDEGDFVKTDGNWIYVCSGGWLYLLDPSPKIVDKVWLGGGCQLLVWRGHVLAMWDNGGAAGFGLFAVEGGRLKLLRSFDASGHVLGSRLLQDGYAYIVLSSPLQPEVEVAGTPVRRAWMLGGTYPQQIIEVLAVDMSNGAVNYTVLAAGPVYRIFMYGDRLYIFQGPESLKVLADAISAKAGELPAAVLKALEPYLARGDYVGLYEELENISAGPDWPAVARALNEFSEFGNTTIYELAVAGLSVRIVAVGQVPGVLTDQFAVAQTGGYLIVASTTARVSVYTPLLVLPTIRPPSSVIYVNGREVAVVPPQTGGAAPRPLIVRSWVAGNVSLYVLNADDLSLVASVEDIAPYESAHAGRLIGGIYYLVTYRWVDPLFAINVTDPAKPKVLGYLKAPAFTDYLHPAGDGYLLGVATAGNRLEVLLYNVTDPVAPSISSNVTVTNAYSPVLGDYHAFLLGRGLAFIPVYGAKQFVLVLGVEGGELTLRAVVYAPAARTLYIGDVYYFVTANGVEAYNATFAKIGEVSLNSWAP